MKLGVIRKIQKDSLRGELPGWLDSFLEPLNDFIEKVGVALQGKLTFADNFSCKIHNQKMVSGVEYIIATGNAQLRPSGVLILSPGGRTVDSWKWEHGASGTIKFTINYTGATDAECSILILLG